MDALPRVLTHRPEALRIEEWAWRIRPGGSRRIAAWLDVSFADGADWHDPPLVLVDVEALAMMEALYGPRAGETIAVAAAAEETPRAGGLPVVDVSTWRGRAWLSRRLAAPGPAILPRLRLVSGGAHPNRRSGDR